MVRQAAPRGVKLETVGGVAFPMVVVRAGAGEPVLPAATPVGADHPLLAYPDTAKPLNSSDLSPQVGAFWRSAVLGRFARSPGGVFQFQLER